MDAFTTALITTLFFIATGYVSTRLGLLDVKTGRTLYKFLFAIPLPIVVFTSLASAKTELNLLVLPLIGGLLAVSLVASAFIIGKLFKFDRKSLGTLMTAAGITSTLSFALPFILVFYGQEAARYLFLYDFGGAIVVWTFVYYISGVMGNKQGQKVRESAANFLRAPMFWALVLGLLMSFTNITLPAIVTSISSRLSSFVSVLILLGIGIFFKFDFFKHKKNLAKILLGVIITMGLSVSLAYVLTSIFGVTGLMQKVVLISALAPAGALTVPFCAEHDLDVEYASALVALATAFSVIGVLFFMGL